MDILEEKPIEAVDTSSLRDLVIGGSSITKEQIIEARRKFPGPVICQAYGQTEMNGIVTIFNINKRLDFIEQKPGSCGEGMSGIDYKVIFLIQIF